VLRCQDNDNLDVLNDALSELRKERQRAARQLEEAQKAQAVPVAEAAAEVEEALRRMETLQERLYDTLRDKLGEVLRLLVSRADVYFEPAQRGRRQWYRFARGVVKLRPILDVQSCDEHLK
jgi:hypothetical protein